MNANDDRLDKELVKKLLVSLPITLRIPSSRLRFKSSHKKMEEIKVRSKINRPTIMVIPAK